MSSARFIVGDSLSVLHTLPDQSVDLVLTSPPFLALRSYLPADHPDKDKEMGSEATPGEFIDALLGIIEECARVLTPHGSLVIELGDTYAGSGERQGRLAEPTDGRGNPDAMRDTTFSGANTRTGGGKGWPMDKSLCLIPELFRIALVYGFNPLTGRETPRWRARNVVRWVRPNPPVGALCVDDQTEALTPDGWKRHDGLIDGDLIAAYDPVTDCCRFAPAKFVRWDREGESMVVVNKRSTSQWLTEDHRVWTKTRKADPHVRLARDLTNDCLSLLCAPFEDVPGTSPVTTERAALLGWYIAEGSLHARCARIVQSETANPQKVQRIRELLDTDGADYRESSYVARYNGSTIVSFTIKGDLAEWLNLHHKRLPMPYVTTWPERQAQALFDALIDGDGHRRASRGVLFHQQSEAIADAMQVLAIRLGYRASKTWQPSMNVWQVTMSDSPVQDRRWTKIRKWDGEGIRRETYSGIVWCPMVETSFWLARRNGKTFITGNSDKFRPATSEMVVACKSRKRYFDLDAVREPLKDSPGNRYTRKVSVNDQAGRISATDGISRQTNKITKDYEPTESAGAPPLDWWSIPPGGYSGSHYAVFPAALLDKPILAMCPQRVCVTCGVPSERITSEPTYVRTDSDSVPPRLTMLDGERPAEGVNQHLRADGANTSVTRQVETTGWTDCGHENWRAGVVLDPFVGSGTTLEVAIRHGRDAIGIDIDERNADLARERVGMFLSIDATPPVEIPA